MKSDNCKCKSEGTAPAQDSRIDILEQALVSFTAGLGCRLKALVLTPREDRGWKQQQNEIAQTRLAMSKVVDEINALQNRDYLQSKGGKYDFLKVYS